MMTLRATNAKSKSAVKSTKKTKTVAKVKKAPALKSTDVAGKTLRLFGHITKVWAPPTHQTLSEWSDENRILRSATAAEPGPWRTDRTPYLREIMDCLSASSPVKNVSFMKSAQVGGSETGNNWIGYVIDHEPGPMLMVQPSKDMARQYSQRNIAPMIADCEVIKNKLNDPRTRDSGNTTLRKEFPGGLLVITGSESAAGLRSMPVKYLFLDEVDAYPLDVEGEGDPVNLAVARTRTFKRRKILKVSTPTIAGESRIEKDYLETDQRKYYVPCPECGFMHVLEWCNFVIPDENGNKLPAQAHMFCPECGAIIEEWHKTEMLEKGQWRMTCPEKENKFRRGYHISTLYAPLGFYSWAEIATDWLNIKKDQSQLKTFINTILGQTWSEDTEIVDYEMLYNTRRRVYPASLDDEVLVLTASVDTQDNRLECELVGWDKDYRSWGIEYVVILGDTKLPAVWKNLDQWLMRQWRYEDGTPLSIACTCIDSGGHATEQVYDFVKPREYRRIYAIKGSSGGSAVPLISKPSTSNRKGVSLFTIGVDTGKQTVTARLKVDDEMLPGHCFFPMAENEQPVKGYDMAYFKGLTVERRRAKYVQGKLKYEWYKPSGARNEPLDLRTYATAALEILNPDLERLSKAPRQRVAAAQNAQIARPQIRTHKRRVLSEGI